MTDTPTQPPAAPPPAPEPAPRTVYVERARRTSGWSIFTAVLLFLVILGIGAILFLQLVVLAFAGGIGGVIEGGVNERVVREGPADVKIAVIPVTGVISGETVTQVQRDIRKAVSDDAVKAVILRIDSPGGGLAASDEIYHLLETELKDKPLVASMDALAASGGYYIACASDHIVAQPMTITGSIGVIAQFFFVRDLLENKLGVTPVTLTVGRQKDWPNPFNEDQLPEDQRAYLMDVILKPGYDRFVDTVAAARKMDRDKVLELATGRVYLGQDAQGIGLTDEVGYFDAAVVKAKALAGVKEARVVEYYRPFGLGDLLGVSTKAGEALDVSPERIATIASPRVMYLWTGQ